MNPVRVAAAAAAVLSALLLQATLVGPVAGAALVSLPAVLVALVALREGPGCGLALGFVCGLLADLGSHHPAGLLALVWMVLGAGCGTARDRHRAARGQVTLAATAAAVAAVVTAAVLHLVGDGAATGAAALVDGALAWPGDLLLAALLWWPVRGALRSPALRTRAAAVRHG